MFFLTLIAKPQNRKRCFVFFDVNSETPESQKVFCFFFDVNRETHKMLQNASKLLKMHKNASKMLLNRFWIDFESILNRFWIDFELILNRFWIDFESILNRFWIDFESILNRFWIELRGSYFCFIVIPLNSRSPAANSLTTMIPQQSLTKNIVWGPRAGFISLLIFNELIMDFYWIFNEF